MIRPSRNDRQGFTLIEAAVCLVLVALLLVTLGPALKISLEESPRAACREHLRTIGQANLAWAADHGGWLVLDLSNPDGSAMYSGGGGLSNQRPLMFHAAKLGTNDYLPNPQFWWCPSDREDLAETPAKPSTSLDFSSGEFSNHGNISYLYVAGYNTSTSLEDPAVAPVLLDESNEIENGAVMPGGLPELTEEDNHGADYQNVLFLDGHVEGVTGTQLPNSILNGIVNPMILQAHD